MEANLIHSSFYKNKDILVAGGSGMIGISLVTRLLEKGANITIAAINRKGLVDKIFNKRVKFITSDLTDFNNCLKVTKNKDIVFNLVGIKGSVGIGETKVASYLVPMLRFQTNLMDAAFNNNVNKFLFVSSICAYPKSSKAKEESTVWDGTPEQNDRIPGIAKRVGELQGESYLKEYKWKAVKIVRPANVYGPHDDYNPKTAQVIPALIARILSGENPLKVWGDGSARRDFIYVEDVVNGMLLALEKAPPCYPINLGSGKTVSIRQIVKTLMKNTAVFPRVKWTASHFVGDPVRLLSTKRANDILHFKPKYSISSGTKKTIEWYKENVKH